MLRSTVGRGDRIAVAAVVMLVFGVSRVAWAQVVPPTTQIRTQAAIAAPPLPPLVGLTVMSPLPAGYFLPNGSVGNPKIPETTLPEGQAAVVRVNLTAPFRNAIAVTLHYQGHVSGPATVVVPAGATYGDFGITALASPQTSGGGVAAWVVDSANTARFLNVWVPGGDYCSGSMIMPSLVRLSAAPERVPPGAAISLQVRLPCRPTRAWRVEFSTVEPGGLVLPNGGIVSGPAYTQDVTISGVVGAVAVNSAVTVTVVSRDEPARFQRVQKGVVVAP